MKKRFTILIAALMLLTTITLPSSVWGQEKGESASTTLPDNPQWVATALSDISNDATVIIISNSTTATNIALPSTTTGSNPTKKACTVSTSGGISTITPPAGTSLQDLAWTLKKITNGNSTTYKFYQEGSTTVRLYLNGTSSNTALRVGDANSSNDSFILGDLGKLLKLSGYSRFVGPYDNGGSDWRTYNTENATNYKGAELTFYVLQESTPTADKCSLTYNANGGTGNDFVDDNDGDGYDPNDEVTVKDNEGDGNPNFTREGYIFVFWNTQANGYGENYEAGDQYIIMANSTLYAKWSLESYAWSMNLTNAVSGTSAQLKVNNAVVAANAKIEYNKEVTVEVTVPNGYIYSISVNGEAIVGNKFNMPASDVLVSVDTEVDPYISTSLDNDDMLSMKDSNGNAIVNSGGTNTSAYGILKFKTTSDGYTWITSGQQNTSSGSVNLGMIQLRERGSLANNMISYIQLPVFNGKIESITMTVTNGSATASDGNACKAILGFQSGNTNSETPIATGGDSSNGTNEILLNLSDFYYSTGYITVTGGSGAARIWNIDVTYRPYQDMTGTELAAIDADRAVSIPENTTVTATNGLTIPINSGILIKSGSVLKVSGNLSSSSPRNIIIENGGQLVTTSSVGATVHKNVAAWNTTDKGWYLISSPITTSTLNSAAVSNLLVGSYDLFRYDEGSSNWENYKTHNNDATNPFNTFENGRGYLYRNAAAQTVTFVGTVNTDVTYSLSHSNGGDLEGFNVVGNPYTHVIYMNVEGTAINNNNLSTGYYRLGLDGGWNYQTTEAINPCEGVLIQVKENEVDLHIENTDAATKANHDNIRFEVSNSQYEDATCAMFDKGNGLNKINHRNPGIPMLYIPKNGENYAIAMMDVNTETFGLNFRAMTMGKYTLRYKTQGEFNYLHIIDRMTGEDIDMLLDGEYSFIGSPQDDDARFIVRLGYLPNYDDNGESIFAYQSGSEVVVSGEGELQIFDITGRMFINTVVNGVETISEMPQGVYIFRMIGSEIKTQKIVVR